MGTFTDVSKKFEQSIQKKLFALTERIPQNSPQFQMESTALVTTELSKMRQEYMQKVCKITNRNLICYVSAWLQSNNGNPDLSINDNDMNGFMNAIAGLDREKGLDLFLHTPGGNITATESIVNYIKKMFPNIRVIVPHMAMSAGTMIACASNAILMGKQSSLGPIDPQYRNVPAQGVLKEFERAIKETQLDPNVSLIWKEIIQQYRPTFVGECENAVSLSYNLVKSWLLNGMLKKKKNKSALADKILGELASHESSKVHDRHFDFMQCRQFGLNVIALEKNQELQDAVLSLHHAYVFSIYQLQNSLKYVENQNGQTFVIYGQR